MYLFQDRFLPKEQLNISPDDRGYYFGDGIYEVIRVYKGRMFEADAHFDRLKRSAEAIRISLPFPINEMKGMLKKLVNVNRVEDGTVYMQITRGAAPRSHPFPKHAEPVLMAYSSEVKRPLPAMRQGITAVTAEDIRWLRCDLKTLNLLPNVLAKQHAVDLGANEAILHRGGTVTECSASNIFMVQSGCLYTHPADNLILHGITRSVVIKLAKALQIPVLEHPFTIGQLSCADEAFITGTTVEITPIVQIDGRPVGNGKPGIRTANLQNAFEKYILSSS